METQDNLTPSQDEEILKNHIPMVKGIGRMFGRHCEVVLHSLKDRENSIIAIENGHVTGRKIGSPMTDFALKFLEEKDKSKEDLAGPYSSQTGEGRYLKSMTMLIRNPQGVPIGLICINWDLSAPVIDFFNDFTLTDPALEPMGVKTQIPSSSGELVNITLNSIQESINKIKGISPTERNKKIVEELDRRGIFDIKDGIDRVAKNLGVSRYTIYNYIRENKKQRSSS